MPKKVGAATIALSTALIVKALKAMPKTKKLSDTKAKLPSNKVYYLAYINSRGELVKVGSAMSFVSALGMLGISGATNSLNKRYKYNRHNSSSAQRTLQKSSSNWGIYTKNQANAKALSSVFGWKEKPEVHGSGMYGHYHDSTRTFHIWYGGKICL